jgi:nitrite reductase/ring-hydroxylating ferredoxin subunit
MTRLQIRVGTRNEIGPGAVQVVELPRGDDRRPREALVLLGSDGEPRAYLNRCRHLPIPIDSGSRRFLTQDGEYLLCGTHGALYQKDDGMCIAGPCIHLALEKLTLVEENGVLFLLLRG